jgi:hypothetical protein
MKKLLTIVALIGAASLSFGQGYVAFNNSSSARISTNTAPSAVGGTVGALAGGAVGSYFYELLVAPVATSTIGSTLAGWTDTGVMGTNIATSGRLSGNNSTDGLAVQVNGYGTAATANFAVVGWSANVATTYADALTWWANGQTHAGPTVQYFGISGVALNIPLAPAGGPYNSPFGLASAGQIQGFSLGAYQVVPEPTTMALAGLGAAALLIFRRRK